MYKVKGNRLRFLGQTPGGLDPSDIMSTRDTIMPTTFKNYQIDRLMDESMSIISSFY